MSLEIERKFLLTDVKTLKEHKGVAFERYFLYIGKLSEIRVQVKGNEYELERKEWKTKLTAHKHATGLTKNEFAALRKGKPMTGKVYRISSERKFR